MSRFRYGLDGLCLTACALYALNSWWVPEAWRGPFLSGHFNDVLLIPAALPWVLWLQARLGLRRFEGAPRWSEILFHLGIWAVMAEVVVPHWVPHAVGDVWDVAAYAIGAGLAGLWWRHFQPATMRPRLAE